MSSVTWIYGAGNGSLVEQPRSQNGVHLVIEPGQNTWLMTQPASDPLPAPPGSALDRARAIWGEAYLIQGLGLGVDLD